jgi:hypothetical protein
MYALENVQAIENIFFEKLAKQREQNFIYKSKGKVKLSLCLTN